MWFSKKKVDVIDLTALQKRGILDRVAKTEEEARKAESFEYKDLSPLNQEPSDIFRAIANASKEERTEGTGIRNKIEDIEFKLDSIRRKIDDILNRLEVVEKKVNIYGR